jgi:hypothetical protein
MTNRTLLASSGSLDETANPLSTRRISGPRDDASVSARLLLYGLRAATRPIFKVSDE